MTTAPLPAPGWATRTALLSHQGEAVAKLLPARKGDALKRFRQEVDKIKGSHKDKLRQLVQSL